MTQSTQQADACACPEFTMSRRRLLGTAAATTGVLAGAQMFGDAFRQVAYGAAPGGNVVVVLSLRGGADGLSMVVPRGADHDILAGLRKNIVVPEASLIGGDASFGLHPAFKPLLPMWQTTKNFAAVHGVGLPMPNRSHFEAMAAIEDADPGTSARIGWINRTVGLGSTQRPEDAVGMGSALPPTSLVGPAPALAVDQVADLALAPLNNAAAATRRTSVKQMYDNDASPFGVAVRSTLDMTDRLSNLADRTKTPVNLTTYPDGPLREVLANTAALIKADLGTQMVTVDYGNWDMHTGLSEGTQDPSKGWMTEQVAHLAGSLQAFFADLGGTASRVTVVTMSEFGRRVQENGDHGVDHGYGNAMLLLGAGVNGGAVRGKLPSMSALNDGDLAVRQDFRSVLWEVLANRFPTITGSKSTVFPNFAPETVGVMV